MLDPSPDLLLGRLIVATVLHQVLELDRVALILEQFQLQRLLEQPGVVLLLKLLAVKRQRPDVIHDLLRKLLSTGGDVDLLLDAAQSVIRGLNPRPVVALLLAVASGSRAEYRPGHSRCNWRQALMHPHPGADGPRTSPVKEVLISSTDHGQQFLCTPLQSSR